VSRNSGGWRQSITSCTADALVLELAFGPLVAMETDLDGIRGVGADLDEALAELGAIADRVLATHPSGDFVFALAFLTLSTKGLAVAAHVEIAPDSQNGLRTTSWVKCEQILTISKERLMEFRGHLSPKDLLRVEMAVRTVLSL
jgi:mRNA-degrading endonuclease toxin of MazEF toxin-antitoxin module